MNSSLRGQGHLGAGLRQLGYQSVVVVTLAAASTGCYRTSNTVTLEPLETKVPVSASGQYVDAQGKIVNEAQYEVVDSFQFEQQVRAPRHDKTETKLDIDEEIDSIVAQAGGQAVTDLRIEATGYDSGSHEPAAMWKQMGWMFLGTGAGLFVVGVAANDPEVNDVMYPAAAVFAGLGGVSFALSLTARKPTEWTFSVGGNVVTRGGGAGNAGGEALRPSPQPASSDSSSSEAAPAEATSPTPGDDAIEPLAPAP